MKRGMIVIEHTLESKAEIKPARIQNLKVHRVLWNLSDKIESIINAGV